MSRLVRAVALCVCMSFATLNASAQETITFESRCDTTPYLSGDFVSQVCGSGGTGPITVSGKNPVPALTAFNTAIIFDSANPTGGDTDLGTPNQAFGGPGVGNAGTSGMFINDVARGNILIIANDIVDTSPADGRVDNPNDSNNAGTFFTFDFSTVGPVTINSLVAIDFDAMPISQMEKSKVELFDSVASNTPIATFIIPRTGDNGVATIALGPTAGVMKMIVMMDGSGAIDDIKFSVGDGNGACCFGDGICQVLSETACEAEQGRFVGAGTNCDGDADGDGVADACDLCPQTPDGAIVNDEGCAFVNVDAGGPYTENCDPNNPGIIMIPLLGTATGGQVPPAAMPATLTTMWTTDCLGASITNASSLSATLNIDTAIAGCPANCNVTLTAQLVPDGGGNPIGLPGPVSDDATVTLATDGMGACCDRQTGACTVTTASSCADGGGDFQGAGTDCTTDSDGDGIADACDLCPDTPTGSIVNAYGCAEVTVDAGGPYMEPCDDLVPGLVVIQLSGSAMGGQVPAAAAPATLSTLWSTDCAGATIDDPTALMTTLTIDTAISGCPANCNVTLTAELIPGGGDPTGTPPPADDDATVTLVPEDQMGACCDRTDGGCMLLTADACEEAGGDFAGTGTNCDGDSDGDGVSDACDLCPETEPGANVTAYGCEPITVDPGGPYEEPCSASELGLVTIDLMGSISGGQAPPSSGATISTLWTTDCAGATIDDPTALTTTMTIDTSISGCPAECNVKLTAMFDPCDVCPDDGVPPPTEGETPVRLFPDCNDNNVSDMTDIENGTSQDCNENKIPDECDIDPTDPDGDGKVSKDCDGNGVPDECQIDETSEAPGGPFFCGAMCSSDCNNNGIPDECESDRDSDGVIDDCDNCPDNPNPDQADADGDGIGDVCDEPGPQPGLGACCMMNANCSTLSEAECNAQGGRYQGDGTDCGSVNCCDPDSQGFNILFSLLFHAPVCGGVCGISALATLSGMLMLRRQRRRRRNVR